MSFNDFFHKNIFQNKATSNMKSQQVFSSIGLDNVGQNLRNVPFESDIGVVNLHPRNGTHWIAYINEIYFDSYGCSPPQKLSQFIIKRNCVYSQYKIQGLTSKRDSYCSS